jgi:outer membrane immunogenic protein
MKKFFLSTVSALALAHGASAADLPTKAPTATYKAPPAPVVVPTWTGWYLGIQGGAARHQASFKDVDNFLTFGGGPSPTYSASRTGGIFGINSGYNFQAGNLVFGVEGDWSWLGAKTDSTVVACAGCSPLLTTYDVRWLATARVRAGLAVDATLFYVTGGAAFGNVRNSAIHTNPAPAPIRGSFLQDTTKTGWTVGGGIEHMFGPHWTARAEARYVDLGRSTVNCTPGTSNCLTFPGTYRGEFRNTLLIGLVGVDFKF